MEEREEKRGYRRQRPSLVWPVILITAGVLFLLSNLGTLEINFWELWRLWPLLLVLAGLDILLGRRSFVGSLIAFILALVVVAGVVLWLVAAPGGLGPSDAGHVERIAEPLDGIERAELEVDLAAGQLDIARLEDSSYLIEGDLGLSGQRQPTWQIDRQGSRAEMSLGYRRGERAESWNWRGGDEWALRLSPQVGLALSVDVGAGEAVIDLTGLDVQSLNVQAGAGQMTVIFPAAGNFSARVEGGVGGLALKIPDEVAARVRIDRGLSGLNIAARFVRDGDVYQTEDWEGSENRLDLEVEVGVGLVTIGAP